MTELKHCPFCGGEARIMKITDSGGKTGYAVGCGRPFCPTDGAVTRWFVDDGLAVEAWNTRHVETCRLNELDALTQTLSMVNGCAWSECSECGCLTPDDSTYCINCGRKVEG